MMPALRAVGRSAWPGTKRYSVAAVCDRRQNEADARGGHRPPLQGRFLVAGRES